MTFNYRGLVRRFVGQQPAPSPTNNELNQWPGEPNRGLPLIFNPKLRTTAFLKGQNGWGENITLRLPVADGRVYVFRRQLQAVNVDTKFQGGSEQRAIPAVFAPTSLANGYSGRSSM